MISTGLSALAMGVITDILFGVMDFRAVPQVADILFMIMGIGLVYAISKYGLMSITPVAASDEILSTMNESLLLLDARGKVVFANKSTLTLLNAGLKELQNASLGSIIGDSRAADELLEETRVAGRAINRELLYQSLTGTATPVLASTAVVKDTSDQEVAGFVVSAMDITEHKRVEAEISAQRELIDRILECIPSAVLVLGRDAKVILANKTFYASFGKTPAQAEGKPLFSVIPVKELRECVSAALAGSASGEQLEFLSDANGRNRIYVASILPMQQELLLVLNDVTDERERQERLSLTDRMVSVGKMASGIAHEVNNPLTSVIGLTQLLLGEKIGSQYREDLKAIYNEAVRASNVIKNLLTFARRHQPVRQAAKISNVVDDVLKLRSYEHRITNIQVDKRYDEQVPDVTIDYFQMQQVFLNIILNAEAAMSEAHGKGQLTISTERVNGHVVVSFKDDGPGVAKENLKRIFDPFYTTKEVGKGTGLGLSICYGIVTNHGGKIYAESEPGRYTELFVELPVNAGGDS